MKDLCFALFALLLITSCGSTPNDEIPKSRFLRTGETRPNVPDEDGRVLANRRDGEFVKSEDRYQTPSDRLILQRIRKALNTDSLLAQVSNRVDIAVIRGNVTLHGTVPTEKDKTEIGMKAQEIAGAGNVVNRLAVVGY